jgi:hypothetical protein
MKSTTRSPSFPARRNTCWPARKIPIDSAVRMLARDTGALLHEVAALRQVQIEVEEPDEPCVAECDPRQLQSALYALLRNAVEAATADGWARLRVEGSEGRIRLVVEDNGVGPTPDQQEHMFDPAGSRRRRHFRNSAGRPDALRAHPPKVPRGGHAASPGPAQCLIRATACRRPRASLAGTTPIAFPLPSHETRVSWCASGPDP